ncbi:hypothetical protein F2Q69_00015155 [Brassica cretica]|uniref:Uncharacterized protein n=1 Tax=Brassica cretica TaxID=69181 RepID=A0A8S9QWL0_BRACR|nr:hypothetical protein F2Q69_00015155 [Brassica cretica]
MFPHSMNIFFLPVGESYAIKENKLEAQVSNLDLVGQTAILKEVDESYRRVTADSTEYGCAYHGDKIVGGIQKLATGDASGSTGFLTIRFGVLLRQNSGNGFGARMSLEVNEDEEKISSPENKLEAQVSNLDLVGQTVVLKEVDESYRRVTGRDRHLSQI